MQLISNRKTHKAFENLNVPLAKERNELSDINPFMYLAYHLYYIIGHLLLVERLLY